MQETELAKMMEMLGPTVQAEEVREFTPTSWAVAFQGEFIVFLEADEESGKLFFVSDLGKITSPNPSEVHRWMLTFASVWQETGGTRLALNPSDETVEFIYDTPILGLTVEKLANQVLNFYNAAVEAQGLLDKPFDDQEAPSPDAFENYVRV